MIPQNNKMLGDYLYDDVYVDSIHSRLTGEEKRIRLFIINYIIDKGVGFDLGLLTEDTCRLLSVDYSKINETIKSMSGKEGFFVEDNIVKFIYPVSSVKTPHRVTLEDGREYSAMCAIDSLGSTFTFKSNTKINSKCACCGESISVEVEDGQVKNPSHSKIYVLHANMKKFKNYGNSC
ncbi:MAG: MerB-like organometallic lyase SaoL [Clostridium sp.]|uniref:MerB-like organometallic lyase SaoL n=1 Tax=Clostridium sp. TaxID=1506 RepID=UPI002FC904E8